MKQNKESDSEIRAGPFCDRGSAKSTVKSKGGGGGGGIYHCQIFSCYAFKRMNTSKMTQFERTGEKVVFYLSTIMY